MTRAQAPAYVLLFLACAAAPACGLNQSGVDPLDNTIAYPASAVMDKTRNWLFVTNSNADLRFNDGTLIALSLERAAADRVPGAHPDECPAVSYANPVADPTSFCCRDPLDPNLTNCDERAYVGPVDNLGDGSGNVRIGSFAAGMALQVPQCPAGCSQCAGYSTPDDRLLIGVRGDTSLTYVDVESVDADHPPLLKCVGSPTAPEARSGEKDGFVACDDAHRVITAMSGLASPSPDPNPPAIPLPDEPYALAVDPDHGLLFVGHLSGNTARAFTGGFSLFDIAPGGTAGQGDPGGHLGAPRFIAPFPSPFPANSVGGVGVTSLNLHDGTVYASSRYVPQVAGLGSTAQCPANVPGNPTPVREIAAFPNGANYTPPLAGAETRGIQFVTEQDGQSHAYVLQRSPPSVIRFQDQFTPTDVLETCSSPTFLDKYDNGLGDRLFVTCFADAEVYVYDPNGPQLVTHFAVGRGPSGLVFDKDRHVAYVVGFGDNNISVIDLTPGSPTEYHVVQHIGFPRVAPRSK